MALVREGASAAEMATALSVELQSRPAQIIAAAAPSLNRGKRTHEGLLRLADRLMSQPPPPDAAALAGRWWRESRQLRDQITGGTADVVGSLYPLSDWIPGASSLGGAERNCAQHPFTGGKVTITQWPRGQYDSDYAC